jgi:fibronectin-binding autotransporter adhesin
MKRFQTVGLALLVFSLLSLPSSAWAAVTPGGDITPASSADWTSGLNSGTVGITSEGTLTVNSGSTASTLNGCIGYNSGAAGLASITGSGSLWKNDSQLTLGQSGWGFLIVTSGGSVTDINASIGAGTNSLGAGTVSGAGSMWQNAGDLNVGDSGSGYLTITNSGTVTDYNATLGYSGSASGVATVSGTGSLWQTGDTLYVGLMGSGNLTISSGGSVTDRGALLGALANSTGSVTVTGSGSTWKSTETVYVGSAGTGNLTVQNGGAVSDADACIGYLTGAVGSVTVSGSGARWTNSDGLTVGYYGSGTLAISSGGTVTDANASLGVNSGGKGVVTVSGSGSTWQNTGALYVGNSGTGTVAIQNGGKVTDTYAYIGMNSGAVGSVSISGSGATWTNSESLTVGSSGTGILTIGAGGTVTDATGCVGLNSTGQGTVTVSGSGARWNNTGSLTVGNSGTGVLTIGTGGTVTDATGYVGLSSGGDGSVTVSGASATWANSGALTVGSAGTGILTISNGGKVTDTTGYVGTSFQETALVTISGSASTWTNTGSLYVGYSSNSGSVTQDGGTVAVGGTLTLASNAGSRGTYNLNAGTLGIKGLSAGSGTSAFNFNGGTLRADAGFATNANATLAGTDTINTNGYGVTWNGALTGNGALVKTGDGTLTLGGSNLYLGGTYLQNGTFVTTGSNIDGSVTISGASTTWINNGNLNLETAFTRTITQSDGLVSVGGTVNLGGAGHYILSGGTLGLKGLTGTSAFTFNGGTLRTDADFATSASVTVAGTTTINTNGHSVTWNGNFSGAGEMNKTGSGTLTLNGVCNYAGTRIKDGTLVATTNNLTAGNIVTYTGSTWISNANINLNNSRIIAQYGGLVNVDGVVNIAADSEYRLIGGTLSTKGLQGNSDHKMTVLNNTVILANANFTTDTNLETSGSFTINTNGNSVTWGGAISYTGTLNKDGDGYLHLTGYNSYSGGTCVKRGWLIGTPSSIRGDLDVWNGGAILFENTSNVDYTNTIRGTGIVQFQTGYGLVLWGTVSPGHSIGTLTVDGNYTQKPGSTYICEFTPDGQSDMVYVTGSASIEGGTLSMAAGSGTYAKNTTYTVLTADGGVTGSYDAVVSNLAFLSGSITIDGNSMYLIVTRNNTDFNSVAATPNQHAVATYLDTTAPSATGDFADVITTLENQTAAGARTAFDAMGGELYGSLATIGIENHEYFLRTVAQHLQLQTMMQGYDDSLADARCDCPITLVSMSSYTPSSSGWTTWADGFGVGASIATNGNASGLGYSTGGLAFGMERQVGDNVRLGIAGGYSSSYVTLDARNDTATIDAGSFALYLHRSLQSMYLTGIAAYGYNSYSADRQIEFPSFDRNSHASYGGSNFSFYTEAGRTIFGSRMHLQPYAALEYIQLHQNDFVESGADSIDITTGGVQADAFRSLLGTRVLVNLPTRSGRIATLEGRAAWRHEFLNENRILDAGFVGQTAGNFAIAGVNVARDNAILGLGLNCRLRTNLLVFANYDALTSVDYTAHAGSGGLQWTW